MVQFPARQLTLGDHLQYLLCFGFPVCIGKWFAMGIK